MQGKCMCCNTESEIYPIQSQLGPVTLNYCAYCEKFKAEPLPLLMNILGEPNPNGIHFAYYDPVEDWYRNYATGNLLEPTRTNEGKGFYTLASLRAHEHKLLAEIETERKKEREGRLAALR